MSIKNDDTLQKAFLCKKIRYTMTKVFYNSYNTVTNRKYSINTYNELLLSQREVNDTLSQQNFLAGDYFSIADISFLCVLYSLFGSYICIFSIII